MDMVQPTDVNANGHYTPGVWAGGLLHISGQLPIDPITGRVVGGDAAKQVLQALNNLDRVLASANLSREAVVSARVYIADIADWDKVNEAYAQFFGRHKPARVIIPTGKLHHGALVEVEAVAEKRKCVTDGLESEGGRA